MLVVSMVQFIIELPDLNSIKDKRRIIVSLKEKLIKKYKISVAEVDLHNSLTFSQIGAVVATNSKDYGEKIMNKVIRFAEDQVPGRIQNVEIFTEIY